MNDHSTLLYFGYGILATISVLVLFNGWRRWRKDQHHMPTAVEPPSTEPDWNAMDKHMTLMNYDIMKQMHAEVMTESWLQEHHRLYGPNR